MGIPGEAVTRAHQANTALVALQTDARVVRLASINHPLDLTAVEGAQLVLFSVTRATEKVKNNFLYSQVNIQQDAGPTADAVSNLTIMLIVEFLFSF